MVFYCKVFEIARFFFLLREQFGWFSMNLGSEPNPDFWMWASCWRLWVFLSLIPKHRAVSLWSGSGNCTLWSLPYLEGQDFCVGITRWRWFLPLMLNQRRSCCWDGAGWEFSRQMEFKSLNSTCWRAVTPCPLNSFLCISVLVFEMICYISLSCICSNPWGDFLGRLLGLGDRSRDLNSESFCLNPECLQFCVKKTSWLLVSLLLY